MRWNYEMWTFMCLDHWYCSTHREWHTDVTECMD